MFKKTALLAKYGFPYYRLTFCVTTASAGASKHFSIKLQKDSRIEIVFAPALLTAHTFVNSRLVFCEFSFILAQCQENFPGILQGSLIWKQVSLSFLRGRWFDKHRRGKMSCSQLAILKLMKNSDEPWQDLLELICERIPPKQNTESLHMRC